MKKLLYSLAAVAMTVSVSLTACATPAPSLTPTVTPTATAAPTVKASPTTIPKPAVDPTLTPQYGGILKVIVGAGGVTKLGSPAEGTVSTPAYAKAARPVIQGLLRLDTNERLVPELATSWDITADGKSIIFHLRKGVKFHDGTAFSAEAVRYALKNGPPAAATTMAKVSSIDIVDDYTLRLNLTQFDANLLPQLAYTSVGMVPSPTATAKPTTPERMASDHMVGTGPFKFVSYQQNVNIKYERFDGYWEKSKPYLDGLEMLEIADETTRLLAFKKGDAHLMDVSPTDAKELAALGYEITPGDMLSFEGIYPDSANPDSPFVDKRVREAVEYAIDKKAIAQTLGAGYYEVLTQYAKPTDARYAQGLVPRNYDPNKAKQLLASAGYANGFKTRIFASTATNTDILVALQSYLKAAGIDATLERGIPAKHTSLSQEGFRNGLFVANPAPAGDLGGFVRNFGALGPSGSGIGFNRSMLRPAGLIEKLDAVVAQPDEAKRVVQMGEIMKLIFDEAIAIPLWASVRLTAADKKVHDLRWNKGHGNLWTPADAWLSK
ncbi:MAG: ABC transporter substrate-binding protein [Chloroflexi bacterium]|nr:ABC transporter substrate-binding protein [Chloroflexota bacterium]